MRRMWLVAVGLVLVGSSCADGSGGALDGQAFESTELVGHRATRRDHIEVRFADGRLHYTAGCHEFFGSYGIDGDRLHYERSPDNWVEASACIGPGRSSALEDWFGELLTAGPDAVSTPDGLVLRHGAQSVHFTSTG